MLAHHGSNALWPAMFAHRIRLGLAYLLVGGLAAVATTQIALADTPPEAPTGCESRGAQEAMALGDQLFERADYQHAGACYQVAGDLERANLAFLRAAGPKSEESAQALRQQGDRARALFTTVARAFHSDH